MWNIYQFKFLWISLTVNATGVCCLRSIYSSETTLADKGHIFFLIHIPFNFNFRYITWSLNFSVSQLAILISEQNTKMMQRHIKLDVRRTFCCLFVFWATPWAYWGSQARVRIGAVAAGLHHSSWQRRILTHWARPGIEPMSSWILVGFVTAEPRRELP